MTKTKALAKINLTLEVVKRLPNGYHEIRTVIMKLDRLFDELFIKIIPGGEGIKITCSSNGIPLGEKNICHKVAQKYLEKTKEKAGIEIFIQKNIPSGAGFGGGSSDGAAVLLALNKHFKNKLSRKQLIEIAQEIGKDIPVFLVPEKLVAVSGMGEKLTPLSQSPKLNVLLINPMVHSSTQKAYEMVSQKLWFMENKKRANISQIVKKAIEKESIKEIFPKLYNDFELVLEKEFPIIRELKMSLLAFGAQGTLMSGAGSSVFGIFNSKKEAEDAWKILQKKYPEFFVRLG